MRWWLMDARGDAPRPVGAALERKRWRALREATRRPGYSTR
jgi:hypothetical protein